MLSQITNGTSFAAPFVAGGLAVIADHFEGQLRQSGNSLSTV